MRVRARAEIQKLNSKIQNNNNTYEELMKVKTMMMEKDKIITDIKGISIIIIIIIIIII